MPADADAYGQALYGALREADAMDVDLILVEQPPTGPAWTAIRDRLRRATGG